MLVDLQRKLLNLVEVRIELELKMLVFLGDESVLLGLRLPSSGFFGVVLLWVDTALFEHLME